MGAGFLVGRSFVEVVSLFHGWSSDCGSVVYKKSYPWVEVSLWGFSLVKVVSLLDGGSSACGYKVSRLWVEVFLWSLLLSKL